MQHPVLFLSPSSDHMQPPSANYCLPMREAWLLQRAVEITLLLEWEPSWQIELGKPSDNSSIKRVLGNEFKSQCPVSFVKGQELRARVKADSYEKPPERVIELSHPAILIKKVMKMPPIPSIPQEKFPNTKFLTGSLPRNINAHFHLIL